MGSTQLSIGDISKNIIIMLPGKNVPFKIASLLRPLLAFFFFFSACFYMNLFIHLVNQKSTSKNVFNGNLAVSIKIKNICIPSLIGIYHTYISICIKRMLNVYNRKGMETTEMNINGVI